MNDRLTGLIAATHTPFDANGELNLSVVEKQAEHLVRHGVNGVFIGGTTGECHSLSIEERLALAKRWCEVVQGSGLRLVIHVGSNCIADARMLAAQAQSLGAPAIAAMPPSYYKPDCVDTLIACCRAIAEPAPACAFYYYHIPSMTGVELSMPTFLDRAAEHVPGLAGMKFTHADLAAYLKCLHVQKERFDVLWGMDEYLLPAVALGAVGAVGSTYNLAAPLYQRMLTAFSRGDLATARAEQLRSIQLVDLLDGHGFMAAAKATMAMLGVDVGPPRLPNPSLRPEQHQHLRASLEQLGFFDWVRSATS